jgi:hypothetical protein
MSPSPLTWSLIWCGPAALTWCVAGCQVPGGEVGTGGAVDAEAAAALAVLRAMGMPQVRPVRRAAYGIGLRNAAAHVVHSYLAGRGSCSSPCGHGANRLAAWPGLLASHSHTSSHTSPHTPSHTSAPAMCVTPPGGGLRGGGHRRRRVRSRGSARALRGPQASGEGARGSAGRRRAAHARGWGDLGGRLRAPLRALL